MTQYTPKDLENWFRGIAKQRISQKKAGKSEYVNDAGYWDGGRCEWGAAHNLTEDCETLAEFFIGITELKNARKELLTFNNQQEFEKSKQLLLTKTTEAINGLQMRTSNNSSIAGVCIIWEDFADSLNSEIENFRKDLELLKKSIENVPYNEAKELQKLLSEERKLQKEIEENERKARNEVDPEKKQKFIFLATQTKDKWKKVLERKKQLKTARLGEDFNPDQHIDNFLKAVENKLAGRPTRPLRTPNQPSPNPINLNNPAGLSLNNPYSPSPNLPNNAEVKLWLEKYWRELLLLLAFLLGFYYISNQPE